jgi:hypothetical protein
MQIFLSNTVNVVNAQGWIWNFVKDLARAAQKFTDSATLIRTCGKFCLNLLMVLQMLYTMGQILQIIPMNRIFSTLRMKR